MSQLSFVTICISTVFIVYLCIGDPKRRRTARETGQGSGRNIRRVAAVLLCLPGIYLILIGSPAAFLNWLGGCTITGWLVTLAFGFRTTVRTK